MIDSKENHAEARRCGERRGKKDRLKGAAFFVILLAAFLFMGCPPEAEETGNLNGTWVNDFDGYITTIKIDTSKKTIEYEGSYKGKIANSPDFTTVNGVLIIEFTSYLDWLTSAEDTDKIGKFGALYWKDLNTDSVYMADAYNGIIHVMFDNLSEANAAFTLDNSGNYIDWSIIGIYTK
jgi:hypothetical protein